MKVLKWFVVSMFVLVLLVGVAAAALVYLVDWNDFRDTVQVQVKKHTGRDLTIDGDLKPSVFPWVGVSIGDISLANADGFGDTPFAQMGSADVKVKLMPLLKKEVNVRTIELQGLSLDLQRAPDGTGNWDDLVKSDDTATETEDSGTETGSDSPAINALSVGGITVSDASVSWKDAQSGTDAKLADFNLKTGAIELKKPFDLTTEFGLSSNSMGLAADVNGEGSVTIDLENQIYSLDGLTLKTDARGDTLPDGKLDATLNADILAELSEQTISIQGLSLDALGLILSGNVDVASLDTAPAITGQLSSNEFNPLDLFATLGIEPPVTADESVLKKASLSMALNATASSATLNDLTIKLDDTTFSGNASVPSLDGDVPPLRFNFGVDAIDLDRYLPPTADETDTDTTAASDPATTGDEPIELPMDLLRQLDIEGEFNVGSVKVSNLTTSDIVVPVNAKNGRISMNGLRASLYQGQLNANATLDATGEAPAYALDTNLAGIEADPLLADLLKKESPLTGKGQFAINITTAGNTVNALTAALNGDFSSAFNDGSVNGVNIGYQVRRARAAFSGQSLAEDQTQIKTDFSTLSVGGQFTNGVLQSEDLDMRSPLLRVGGAGQVDLPGEQVDYTLTTLITGSAEGQGGKELEALKGVKLNIPVTGSFDELSADFAGIILAGLKSNITGQFEARAKAEADQLKQEAQDKLDAEEARARAKLAEEEEALRARLDEEKAKAQEKIDAQKSLLKEKADEAIKKNQDKVKDKLKDLFK